MKILFEILRRSGPDAEPYWQAVPFETEDERETVATALTRINEAAQRGEAADSSGQAIRPVQWESSCLQKKCGACAMLVAGRPRLACDSFLKEFAKKGSVTLAPLTSFPVVEDLLVDRSLLFENLKTLQVWTEEAVRLQPRAVPDVYDSARCLQCGCCVEVCPNFCPGGDFAGAAGFVPTAGLLLSASAEQRDRVRDAYRQHVYNGCGKSLACEAVCPAGIDISRLLSRSNALAVWRIPGRGKHHDRKEKKTT